MLSKISLTWITLIVGGCGIVLALMLGLLLTTNSLAQNYGSGPVPQSFSGSNAFIAQSLFGAQPLKLTTAPKPLVYGLPARLKIPKIKVDAPVTHLGLAADGTMEVPKQPDDVAWFNLGPHPGEMGSAVISGHYTWYNGATAVFDNLYKLRQGDKIYIEDENGTIVIFVVTEIKTYDQDAEVPQIFSPKDGRAHLNLITCGGSWDKASKSYSKRLVIFTDQVTK